MADGSVLREALWIARARKQSRISWEGDRVAGSADDVSVDVLAGGLTLMSTVDRADFPNHIGTTGVCVGVVLPGRP